MRRRHPGLQPIGFILVVLAAVLSGCVGDDTIPAAGPLTLREANTWARAHIASWSSTAQLVGFVGHEGPPPAYLTGALAEHVVAVDTSSDARRADGRALTWALLYGTAQGELIRVVVRDAPREIEAEWIDDVDPALVRQLWGLNLGGRLVYDSPTAVAGLREQDERIASHLVEHPDGDVVYASTVAPVDGPGTEDLLYEVYFAETGSGGEGFAYYGQVHHFTGNVVATGDPSDVQQLRRITLIEETFSLGPYPPSIDLEEDLPRRVQDAKLFLNATGIGTYTLTLFRGDEQITRIEGAAHVEPGRHEAALGTLEIDRYRILLEVQGRIDFELKIDGTIGL